MSGIQRSELLLMVWVHTYTVYFVEKKISDAISHKYQRQCKNLEAQGMGLASWGSYLKLLSRVGRKWKMCYAERIGVINGECLKPDLVLLLHLFLKFDTWEKCICVCIKMYYADVCVVACYTF